MKVAVSDYQTKTASAKKKCEAAFDKAAEGYRGKKDLATAKAVLAEKEQFFKGGPAAVDTRRTWKGSRGSLVLVKDGEWNELTNTGGKFVFKEASRTEKYIELVDMSRGAKGVSFRIEADKMLVKWPDKDSDWRTHSEGAWQKSK